MAEFNSSKVTSLIDRVFGLRARKAQVRTSGAPRSTESTIEALRNRHHSTGEEIDSLWLERMELRSLTAVREYLETTGFRYRHGTITTLFMDRKCGLIAELTSACASSLRTPGAAVRDILAMASSHHAHGVIIATNDPQGTLIQRSGYREFMRQLHSKGEAIDVFVLNHLIHTAGLWTSILEYCDGGQSRCAC